MIDGKSVRQKLIGSDDQRAVSPVIGVILMVAITVILAAVIAAFVLDMGSGMEDQAQAGVEVEGESTGTQTVTVQSMANADSIEIRDNSGNVVSDGSNDAILTSVGQSYTFAVGDSSVDYHDGNSAQISGSGGTYSVIALNEDGSGANTIATFDIE